MIETNTMYYKIKMQTSNTIHDLTLCDTNGHLWRFRYYGVDYMLMYMQNADMTYIHTTYRDRNILQWLPGEVVGYFYGMPHEYDFTKELHIDWAAQYRERIAELKKELDIVTNNCNYFVEYTRKFADELDHSNPIIKKFVDWLYNN